jgi:hypothetical protein
LAGGSNSPVTNCFSTGSVLGNQFVGGLIGTSNGTVNSCYSSCNVFGNSISGSFVGCSVSSGIFNNCYGRGNVTNLSGAGAGDCGGFIGYNNGSIINYCFSTGRVIYSGTTDPTDKGFLGIQKTGSYTCNFWDTQSSLQSTTGGIAGQYASGKITSDLNINSTFTGWDGNIWNIDPAFNNGYPYLKWQNPSGTPLPVELFSFTANVSDGRSIKLNWETKTEINTNKFIVESKSNLTYWVAVATVNASGESNSPKQYSFTSKNLKADNYQFRLKMIDNNGSFIYSKSIEAIISLPENFELSQNYPNPFNPTTKINYTLPVASRVTLEVFNIEGVKVRQLVNTFQSAGYYSIDFNLASVKRSVSTGVYFYRITASDIVNKTFFSSVKKMILVK